jgi:hypothetical protein|tara:strand:+ start:123 stop:380 length:258 start_codon:yes stop_codon:yes gene_type:complete
VIFVMPETDPKDIALLLAKLDFIQVKLDEMCDHQKAMNGRVFRAETRLAVLEDRSPSRVGMVAGSTVAAIGGAIYAFLQLVGTAP